MLDIALLADNSLKTVNSLDEVTEFRVTGLVSLETCPKRWAAEIQGAKLTDPKALERSQKYSRIGTAAHHVVEAYLRGELDPEDDEWWGTVSHFCMKAGMPPNERENLRAYLGMLAPWRDRMRHTEHKVGGRDLDTFPVAGTLDYVGWCEEDGCWDILDHKTNREFEPAEVWAQKLQPQLYTALLRRWLCETGAAYAKPIRYTIGYVNLGQFAQWITDAERDDLLGWKRYRHLLEEFLVYRRTGEFPARVNAYCSNCPVRATCPAARAAVENLAGLVGEMEEANVSLLARHEFLTDAAKLAAAMLEEVREEIRERMTTTGEEAWEDDGWTATLKARKTRSASFSAVYDSLLAYGELMGCDFDWDEIVSVKVTALDKLAAKHPEIAPALVGVVTTEAAETPTLSIRKLKGRTLQRVDI